MAGTACVPLVVGVAYGADIIGGVEKARQRFGIERLEAGLGRAVDEGAGQAGRIGRAVVRPRLEDRLDSRVGDAVRTSDGRSATRSEEHTSELQSLMRISYAVLCLKKTKTY